MPALVRMKIDDSDEILVEVQESEGFRNVARGSDIIEKLEVAFDETLQRKIVENCKVLLSAFERLKQESLPPSKATAEFGLQFTAEGNVYLVKTAAQATFKISFQWDL